jgi:plasmid stabilization system protein ParE
MPTIVKRPQAEADLDEIWWYIAQDNPDAADRMLDRIEESCNMLNQTTGHWNSVTQVEKTQAVCSERSHASGEVEERAASGLSGLRLRCATLRPNGEKINCW